MPKWKVMLGRLVGGGSHRAEVARFLVAAELYCLRHPDTVSDFIDCPIQRFPASVARNLLVKTAKQQGVDLLFMIDDDMRVLDPDGFFAAAFEFLAGHQGPAVIGSPYCTAPPQEQVCVFEWGAAESGSVSAPLASVNVVREDACRRTGIERVINIGTGCIAYRMDAFKAVQPPYFAYQYNPDHTEVIETEDCWCHRRLVFARVPVYVDWDHWSEHWKGKWVGKPRPVTDEQIEGVFMRQARAELEAKAKKQRQASIKLPREICEDNTFGFPFGGTGDGTPDPGGFEVLPPGVIDLGPPPPAHAIAPFDPASLVPVDVEGFADKSLVDLYAQAVEEASAEVASCFVEVGAWKGQSAILMARLIKRSGKSIAFDVVDHFCGNAEHIAEGRDCSDLRGQLISNLETHNCRSAVLIRTGESVSEAVGYGDGTLDFVFLDASHDAASVAADVAAWLPKVKPGGVLAGHDFNWDGVAKAIWDTLGPNVEQAGTCWRYRVPVAATVAAEG